MKIQSLCQHGHIHDTVEGAVKIVANKHDGLHFAMEDSYGGRLVFFPSQEELRLICSLVQKQ
jgi:hypothetical protein